MQATQFIWQNGTLVPWEEAKIHVLSHTLHYGGGAFEGIRFYNTEKGPAIFRLHEHVDRLLYSADVLKMSPAYTQTQITQAILHLLQANAIQEGYIRPLMFYGYGKMGVNPLGCPTELMIACWPWSHYLPHDIVDVKVSDYIRVHPRSTVIDAKLCGHYVNGILASLALTHTHYHEVLFLDAEGYISEGAGENFFIVKNKTLYTPPLGTILAGITRNTVLKLAEEEHIPIVEKNLSLSEVYEADEAFFTGTAAEITGIRSVDDHTIATGETGPITALLKQTYHQLVRGKHPLSDHYLTYVHLTPCIPSLSG